MGCHCTKEPPPADPNLHQKISATATNTSFDFDIPGFDAPDAAGNFLDVVSACIAAAQEGSDAWARALPLKAPRETQHFLDMDSDLSVSDTDSDEEEETQIQMGYYGGAVADAVACARASAASQKDRALAKKAKIAKARVTALMACVDFTANLSSFDVPEDEYGIAGEEQAMDRFRDLVKGHLDELSTPLGTINHSLRWATGQKFFDKLKAAAKLAPGWDVKTRTDLRSDRLVPGLWELIRSKTGTFGEERAVRVFAMAMRTFALCLKPGYDAKVLEAIRQFGEAARYSPAAIKSLLRALTKAFGVDDYRYPPPLLQHPHDAKVFR